MADHGAQEVGMHATGVDLSTISIGRQQQLALFKCYLHRWKDGTLTEDADRAHVLAPAPSPSNRLQGLLVLLYGRGGFGKSTLLRHYRNIVVQENHDPRMSNVAAAAIIDWEVVVEGKRSLFNPPPGEAVDAYTYYEVLCGHLAFALAMMVMPAFCTSGQLYLTKAATLLVLAGSWSLMHRITDII